MNKAFNKVIKSHLILTVLSVFATILMIGGVSYSLFQIDKRNATDQTISVGTLSAGLTSINGAIVVSDLYPESASEIDDTHKKYDFTIANTGTYDIEYEIYLKDATDALLANTTEYSSYKRIASTHYQYINYKLDDNKVSNLTNRQTDDKFIILKGQLPAGTTEDHSLQFFLDNKDTTSTGAPNDIAGSILSLDIYFDGTISETQTITNKIAALSKGNEVDFDSSAPTYEGVFEMEDDYGKSYYFRGAADDNYLKFGKNSVGEEMWWRIIRINGNGSLRILYDGTAGHTNGESSTDRVALSQIKWNDYNDDVKYVGYMFGGAAGEASTSKEQAQKNETSSTIKQALDSWYVTNILNTGYADYIEDAIFCNDRSTTTTPNAWSTFDTTLGYGNNETVFGAYSRNKDSSGGWKESGVTATFKCPQKNDAFTVNDTTKGNGALTYPVGLITADEVVAAGSRGGVQNTTYFLTKGEWYWTFSPNYFLNINGARSFAVSVSGNIYNVAYTDGGAVVPVINLSKEYTDTLIGTGTIDDPYHLEV